MRKFFNDFIINEQPYEKGAFVPDDLVADDFDDPDFFVQDVDEDDNINDEDDEDAYY